MAYKTKKANKMNTVAKEYRLYTYEEMMDLAGWMAAADNKRPISELKQEAEYYVENTVLVKRVSRLPNSPVIYTKEAAYDEMVKALTFIDYAITTGGAQGLFEEEKAQIKKAIIAHNNWLGQKGLHDFDKAGKWDALWLEIQQHLTKGENPHDDIDRVEGDKDLILVGKAAASAFGVY